MSLLAAVASGLLPFSMPTREDPEQVRWFVEQVLPLGAFLRSWLRGRFGPQVEIDDIVQESYSRLLRAHAEGTVVSPKAFLFHAARNLALNQIRHRFYTHPSPLMDTDVSSVLDTGESVPESVARAEDIQLLIQAIQSLPARCRQVFTLRKIYGLSQKEIAARLGISESTVEVQGAIGVRKCAEYFQRHGDVSRQP